MAGYWVQAVYGPEIFVGRSDAAAEALSGRSLRDRSLQSTFGKSQSVDRLSKSHVGQTASLSGTAITGWPFDFSLV